MNRTHILNVAGKVISGLSEIRQNVFKGTLNVANRMAGVYFFDLNNQPPEDFDAYQENLLANEFYAHPGSLQWNYYLFLLNDKIGESQKESIEKNDKYARKYVLTEDEFTDFFTLEKSDAKIRPNIVATWKQRLDDVGLQDVYTLTTYVDLVNQFNQQGNTAAKKKTDKRADGEVDKVKFINRLVMKKDYLPYPAIREFDFGKVNLFRGINGVGKTSLFEGIEAMICGKCLRNPGITIPKGCLEAEFNSSGKLILFDSKNSKLYQSRDLNWYATNSRNNTLYNSFNRFNFFNADAAHTFSSATTEKEASEALFSIILGPEYHYISDRCSGTLERLRPEFNKLSDEMQSAQQTQKRTQSVLDNYREPKSISRLRETILNLFKDLKFIEASPIADLMIIEERNNGLRSLLNNLQNDDSALVSLSAFKNAFEEFRKKQALLSLKENELRTLTEKQTSLIAEGKELNLTYTFLNRCVAYVQDQRLMELNDIQAKEGAANLLKSKIRFVKNLIKDSDLSGPSGKLNTDQLLQEISELTVKLKKDEAEMSELLKSYSRLETVVQQIKSYGKDFLTLNKDACDCPLCQATYTNAELTDRISAEKQVSDQAGSGEFDILRTRIEGAKFVISEKEIALQNSRNIIQGFTASFPDEPLPDIALAFNRLNLFIADEAKVTDELTLYAEIRRHADALGFSEKEFKELKFACEQNLKLRLAFAYGHLPEFEKLLNETAKAINDCNLASESTTMKRTEVGNEIKEVLGVEGNSIYLKDIKELVAKEETALRNAQRTFDALQLMIALDEHLAINELRERSELLQNNILSLREEQKIQFEYDTAVKEHDNASKFVGNNQERLKRYKKAVETLRALTGEEASSHVTAFFQDNFQEIIDIFKAIHVPKEFKTLKYEDNRLELITEKNEARKISQISTGQRSALALSIFLSLNGKLANGPDLIMFDDPVAFIDDLNTLSFLDFLRLYTLKSGKQIFFATANMRLAGLFEKKFSFLGDDFKKFELTRS